MVEKSKNGGLGGGRQKRNEERWHMKMGKFVVLESWKKEIS